ncbi:TetR/AcrR family transcriptional regulator [Pseudomonas sp. NKUCC02_KPG]|uniref:TetR/AcrR family transcriptional regulator n=1 Tax=Pseudomonas sp. NKUCC02_KPG TaxID=2842124 RepID=UPI001C5B3605|nr:TetR/AcrR family transcriptional regulator [Pseudomonas sp. NKUCC02_KPG]MBW3505454.1 TetR/AcrR family transcriptional regulator [Pseudomonas sp. NKUCC02_KPG]
MTNAISSSAPRTKGRPRTFDRDQALLRALTVFWRRGYEPASVAELCTAMGINPPSLYAAFGNKAKLFLEAVDYYETTFWDATWEKMGSEPDLVRGISDFFQASAAILTEPMAPCGCMVVLAAVNVSEDAAEVSAALKALRQEGRDYLQQRLDRGVEDGQLKPQTNTSILASALNTLLEGMSLQAHDGASREDLEGIGATAVAMLTPSLAQ